jgi:hypothetical protein
MPGTRREAAGLAPRFNDFSLCAALGDAGKFRFPDAAVQGPVAGLRYALHFDAGWWPSICALTPSAGRRAPGAYGAHGQLRQDGFLDELIFSDGTRLQADLYIDCSGFRGVLIEQGAQDRLSRLERCAAVRSRVAVPTRWPPPAALHGGLCATCRLALAHSLAASRRQRLCVFERPSATRQALDDLLGAVGEKPLANRASCAS